MKLIEPVRGRTSVAEVIPLFKPFPVDALPDVVRDFVRASAEELSCDASYFALPLLSALAAAIGNTRRVEIRRRWTEPAIVWTCIVGDSGTMKSPALELALRPVRARQEEAMKLHGEAGRCWCDDTTVAALSVLLLQNPRGLLMARDELAGWLCGFERRSGGRAGSEVARWLEVFGGRPLVVDRKTGVPPVVHVPRAAVSVTGGIQPAVLKRALVREYFENGLAARLLLAYPPRRVKKWTEAEVDREVEARLDEVFRRLYALEPEEDERGEPCPRLLGLTDEARAAWIGFYGEHAEEQAEMTGDLAAAWSKLEGYAARLALVVELVRRASGESAAGDNAAAEGGEAVGAEGVRAGVTLARWFGYEARRIYALLGESEDEGKRRRLVELIERRGGGITVRELQQSSRLFPTAQDAERALAALVERRIGMWAELRSGGRGPVRREFRLRGAKS